MGFTLIRGAFAPDIGQPDGDSVRFIADNLALWSRLRGIMDDPGTDDSVQLRFEGIDSIEKNAIQPLAKAARDHMFKLIGVPGGDGRGRGYILARRFGSHGRPIAFLFRGDPEAGDGTNVFLDVDRLRESVNYRQAQAGYAYPLFYDTLFRDLRVGLTEAVAEARMDRRGNWESDASETGVLVVERADLRTIPPIWPKLWRRLEEYLRSHIGLGGFLEFVAAKEERADDLTTLEQKRMHHFFEVDGNRVKMNVPPENLRVVSSQ